MTVPFRRVLTVLATPMPSLLVATAATWWLEHDVLRADSRGPILAVVLLAVDALVFCLVYLAVLTVFARSTVVKIVRIVPVLIARFRREALADTTTKLSTRVAEAGATSPEHRTTKAPAQSPSAAPRLAITGTATAGTCRRPVHGRAGERHEVSDDTAARRPAGLVREQIRGG